MVDQEQPRIPFQGIREEDKKEKVIKGVKLNNENSRFAKQANDIEEFEKQADAIMDRRPARNKRAFELAQQFLAALRDKTLDENKTMINRDVETELKNNLVNFLIEINNDLDEDRDCMGSAAVISLLLKSMLIQRDIINETAYKVSLLEKELSSLRKSGITR